MNKNIIFTETQTLEKNKKQKIVSICIVVFALVVVALSIATRVSVENAIGKAHINVGFNVSTALAVCSYLLVSFLATLVGKRSGNYYPLLTVNIISIISFVVNMIVVIKHLSVETGILIEVAGTMAIVEIVFMSVLALVTIVFSLIKIIICKNIEACSTADMKEKFISM